MIQSRSVVEEPSNVYLEKVVGFRIVNLSDEAISRTAFLGAPAAIPILRSERAWSMYFLGRIDFRWMIVDKEPTMLL